MAHSSEGLFTDCPIKYTRHTTFSRSDMRTAPRRRWPSLHIKPAQIIGQAHVRVCTMGETIPFGAYYILPCPVSKEIKTISYRSYKQRLSDNCRPYPVKLAQRQLIDSCHVTSNLRVDTLMNCPHRHLFSSISPCIDSFV